MLGLIFGFKGRIDRGTWWMAYIGCIFLIIAGYSMARIGKDISHSAPMSALPLLFGALFCNLLGLIVIISTCVKRYHDRNKSGWWFWLGLIPIVGGLWQLIELGFCSGDDAPNRFGPPPGTEGRSAIRSDEVSQGSTASSGRLAKLDDDYLANYAKNMATQQATQQMAATSSFGQNNNGRPAFGKR